MGLKICPPFLIPDKQWHPRVLAVTSETKQPTKEARWKSWQCQAQKSVVGVAVQASTCDSQISECDLGQPMNSSFRSKLEAGGSIFAVSIKMKDFGSCFPDLNLCVFLISDNRGSDIPEQLHFQLEMLKIKPSKYTVPVSTNQRKHQNIYRCFNYRRHGY